MAAAAVLLSTAVICAPAPTRVTIDEQNRLLLNGKPWFPICLSPGPPLRSRDPLGRDAMDTVKAGGINSFRVGGAAPDAVIHAGGGAAARSGRALRGLRDAGVLRARERRGAPRAVARWLRRDRARG
ncbi:MAG: hypothetical protein NTU88_07455, partial [Armatimonadetes bacterium]|nr:hypothetical protein [Armatimonadota bacterium]